MNSETVEAKVKLSKTLYRALEWYLPNTAYWVSDDLLEDSLSEWMAQTVRDDLEAETNNGVPVAADFLAEEFKGMLDPRLGE